MSVRELATALTMADAGLAPVRGTVRAVPGGVGKTVDIIVEAPETLAKRAGVSLELYSMARLIASEGYGGAPPPGAKSGHTAAQALGRATAAIAIGQSMVNEARARGVSLTQLVTSSRFPAAVGHYGEQRGRWAATSRDARRFELVAAGIVLRGEAPDLVRGGRHFLSPAVWGEAIRKGMAPSQAGERLSDFQDVVKGWIVDEGSLFMPRAVPGLDDYFQAHFRAPDRSATRQMREASLSSLLRVLDDGIAGRNFVTPGDPDTGPLAPLLIAGAAALAYVVMS